MSSADRYDYHWPPNNLATDPSWRLEETERYFLREMPEDSAQVAKDSRWPAMFPSAISFVTTGDGNDTALEKVVGATIVNRFPYVIALSFCRDSLSARHHPRRTFTRLLERTGSAAVQFLPPGSTITAAADAIASIPERSTGQRIAHSGLGARPAVTNHAPVFRAAYLAYEATLAQPRRDFDGQAIYDRPWIDVGSHRIYFLEINAIQLRTDLAAGRTHIRWHSLPEWRPRLDRHQPRPAPPPASDTGRYTKGYTPDYVFPSPGTVAFEADTYAHGMAVRFLPPLPEDQVEVDNDRARWPCFFPSSMGMITTWERNGVPNLMPCGSTSVVSRHPLIIAPCVSYAAINQRYAPRASLEAIRRTGHFGCGVPYDDPAIVGAINCAGNRSIADDPDKIAHSGLAAEPAEGAPILTALPLHFDCQVTGEIRLGTHIMFLGQVQRIRVRCDVTRDRPVRWRPWADVTAAAAPAVAMCH